MRRISLQLTLLILTMLMVQHAWAQFGSLIDKAKKIKKGADIVTPWSPAQESAIGEASAAKLINVFGLYQNPDMVDYVNMVGNTVARQAPRDIQYHFAILDTEAVDAMGLPGGYVFVTRGLLANISNEAQLAGVLGHEIAHVDRRHLEKEVRAQKTAAFAKEEAAERVPTAAELINMAGQVVTTALTSQVSRDKETEADKMGLDLAAKAGYAPSGLRDILEVLAKASDDSENKRALGLWQATHPPFSERVSTLTGMLAHYQTGGQLLDDRYSSFVNPQSFAQSTPPPSEAGGAPGDNNGELDGIISKGVVVLLGGQLPEGTRVKVRVVQ
jgi:predicted Zn-dependent protease